MDPLLLLRVDPVSGVPIYRQLMDQVVALSAGGRLKPGDLLPSVRAVAERLRVNPMTVSKAWSLLEREGLIEHVRGLGMRLMEPPRSASASATTDALKPLASQLAAAAIHRRCSRKDLHRLLDRELDRLEDSHG